MNFEPQDVLATPASLASTDAEYGLVSILMNFSDAFDEVSSRIQAEMFTVPELQAIYRELCRQMAAGKGCDALTIGEALEGQVSLPDVFAVSESHSYSAAGVNRLADIVVERHKSRQLFALSHTLVELAHDRSPVQDRIDRAQAELMKLEDTRDADDWVGAFAGAMEHLQVIEDREAGKIRGMSTGLPDLDELLDGGMQRGNLFVIGARPAMGKSAIAMTIGLHMAQEHSVGLLSMEMPHADVRDRQMAILGHIPIANLKRPSKGLEYDRLVDAAERAKLLKFYVTDRSGLNILQLRSRARALKRRHGLDVLIVDYIGLMPGLDSKQPRAYQIEEISRGLKGLAKELDMVVVCLAQVNRGVAERASQVPGLSDLRDSGAIEQDADVVAFIHRPIAANPDLGPDYEHYALLRVAKNRQGRIGDVHLFYQGDQTRFAQWSGLAPSHNPKAASARRTEL